MDLSAFAGADYLDVELAGTAYRVGELTLREWAPVQAWIKANVPGPLSSLGSPDFKALPKEVKRELQALALEQDRSGWPPMVGTVGWFRALDHPGGHEVVLLAVLARHRPGTTLDECRAILEKATYAEFLPAIAAALGMDPNRPKSTAPPSPATALLTAMIAMAGAMATTTTSPGPSATTSGKSPTSSPPPGDGGPPTSSA